MPDKLLTYDNRNMLREAVGLHGASSDELKREKVRLQNAKEAVVSDFKNRRQGWLGCADDERMVKRILTLAALKRKKFDTCLVLGIGGSDLGARAAYQALKHTADGMRLVFAGNNTDPDELEEVLSTLDWRTTLINIISKSGDTIEPMSAFLLAKEKLLKTVGNDDMAKHIVATTDRKRGSLKQMADDEGFETLPVPENIGGRFSVLTPVGLFPLACAGIDIKGVLAGAGRIASSFIKAKPENDPAVQFALLHVLADTERRQNIHVLMPYGSRLEQFGRWFRQIWAESLGKKNNLKGDQVNTGPTPIAALGATDQHSQIQLYNEGPDNKVITFIKVEKFDSDLKVPHTVKTIPSLSFLAGKRLNEVIHAEMQGTAEALRANKRPNGTLVIPEVSTKTVGALFMFFEIATGIAGRLYDINAYDQPGVEEGKLAARAILSGGK